jgi:hypothetical protein
MVAAAMGKDRSQQPREPVLECAVLQCTVCCTVLHYTVTLLQYTVCCRPLAPSRNGSNGQVLVVEMQESMSKLAGLQKQQKQLLLLETRPAGKVPLTCFEHRCSPIAFCSPACVARQGCATKL